MNIKPAAPAYRVHLWYRSDRLQRLIRETETLPMVNMVVTVVPVRQTVRAIRNRCAERKTTDLRVCYSSANSNTTGTAIACKAGVDGGEPLGCWAGVNRQAETAEQAAASKSA